MTLATVLTNTEAASALGGIDFTKPSWDVTAHKGKNRNEDAVRHLRSDVLDMVAAGGDGTYYSRVRDG